MDLCATVPIYYWPNIRSTLLNQEVDKPLLGTTYWLFWALEVAGSMREVPPGPTGWIVQCFERIHEKTGISVAQRAAWRLKDRI